MREITEPFRHENIKSMIWVEMCCINNWQLHSYIQPSNLSSALANIMQTRQCIMPHQSIAASFMIIYYRQIYQGKPVWTVWTRLGHIDKKTGLLIEFMLKKPDVIRIPFRWLKAYLNFQVCCCHMTGYILQNHLLISTAFDFD